MMYVKAYRIEKHSTTGSGVLYYELKSRGFVAEIDLGWGAVEEIAAGLVRLSSSRTDPTGAYRRTVVVEVSPEARWLSEMPFVSHEYGQGETRVWWPGPEYRRSGWWITRTGRDDSTGFLAGPPGRIPRSAYPILMSRRSCLVRRLGWLCGEIVRWIGDLQPGDVMVSAVRLGRSPRVVYRVLLGAMMTPDRAFARYVERADAEEVRYQCMDHAFSIATYGVRGRLRDCDGAERMGNRFIEVVRRVMWGPSGTVLRESGRQVVPVHWRLPWMMGMSMDPVLGALLD